MKWKMRPIAVVLFVVLLGIQPVSAARKPYIKVSSGTKVYVLRGKTAKIKAETINKKKKITYKSSNRKVATVTSKGTIKGKRYGIATIYVKAKGIKTKKIKVYIKKPVTGLKVTSATVVTFSGVGKTSQIKAAVTPNKKILTKILHYKSANTMVASVTKSGKITAKGSGNTTVMVSTSGKAGKVYKKSIQVYVNIPVNSISAKNIKLKEWESKEIRASVSPSNATTKTLSYQSSNNKIVSVSSEGVVTGINAGTAKITIKAMDNKLKPKTKVMTVQVSSGCYHWPEGITKVYANGKTQFTINPEKITKTEVLFRSNSGKIYSYTIKDVKRDFGKLKKAGKGTEEEKNGIKVSKISNDTFEFMLSETKETYKILVDYDKYKLFVDEDFTDGQKLKFNSIN